MNDNPQAPAPPGPTGVQPEDNGVFFRPRLVGGRFESGGVPLSVLEDFKTYELLVVAVAKHLYIQENSGRQRVPKGFADRFQLSLQGVGQGSAVPYFHRNPPHSAPDVFDAAREHITAMLEASEPGFELMQRLPVKAVKLLKSFGKSLLPEERMEIPRGAGAGVVVFDAARRDKIVEREFSRATVSSREEVMVWGRIKAIDNIKRTLTVVADDDNTITCAYGSEHERDILEANKTHRATGLRLTAVGVFDANRKLARVVDLSDVEIESYGPDVDQRLDELAVCCDRDGWMGEGSLALGGDLVEKVRSVLKKAIFEYNTFAPLIFPTPEGGLQAEWRLGKHNVEAEFLGDGQVLVVAYPLDGGDEHESGFAYEGDGVDIERVSERLAQEVNRWDEV